MTEGRISRREFLKSTVVGGGAALTLAATVPAVKAAPGPQGGRILDAQEWATIEAATARIVPTDQDPGAKEAGAVNYIDQQLAVYYHNAQQLYHDGIKRLDAQSQKLHGAKFVDLSPEHQDMVLEDAEKNDPGFFGALRQHTMEGCLADPEYGGNKGRIMWKVVGFPGRKLPEGYTDLLNCAG